MISETNIIHKLTIKWLCKWIVLEAQRLIEGLVGELTWINILVLKKSNFCAAVYTLAEQGSIKLDGATQLT